MITFATTGDLIKLWRLLQPSEMERAEALIETVSNLLRYEAEKLGKNLDEMANNSNVYASVVKSVVVDVVARALMTSTEGEPMTQFAQSAVGYSVSGSYLVPGGGILIKESEMKRLGLKRQRIGAIELCPYLKE